MKCILREQLARKNLSVRSFAEQCGNDADALSYSTIDNFIRKGTGHLDTAWAITKKLGISLDEAFIDDDKTIDDFIPINNNITSGAEAALIEIISIIVKNGKIKTTADISKILYSIGETISTTGYINEGAKIIDLATDVISCDDGGVNCE